MKKTATSGRTATVGGNKTRFPDDARLVKGQPSEYQIGGITSLCSFWKGQAPVDVR